MVAILGVHASDGNDKHHKLSGRSVVAAHKAHPGIPGKRNG